MRNTYKLFVESPERKEPLGRAMRRLEDNIKIDLIGIR
jgi:hypothetical protein